MPAVAAVELVIVGTSLGGLSALQALLKALPGDFPAPLVIVQHRGVHGDSDLIARLRIGSRLVVVEPDDKAPLLAGRAYLAPPDYHLLVGRGVKRRGEVALSTEERVNYARPSIDVLFESAADSFGAAVLAVVLTGASIDGARGLAAVKARGGQAVVQDPKDAECRIMPDAALAACSVDRVLPLAEIPTFLCRATAGRR